VASPEVKEYWDGLTPLDRREMDVPETLISLDELAGAVIRLVTDGHRRNSRRTCHGMVEWRTATPDSGGRSRLRGSRVSAGNARPDFFHA